ncbi:hypothetical protein EV426DRAFT_539309, partial [Tirmania nivea]
PTLVIEVGLSQSLRSLRGNADWWLRNSAGAVKIVLLFTLTESIRKLEIEKWELAAPDPNRPQTRAVTAQGVVPCNTQRLVITNGGSTVVGAPLSLAFESIFLRPPVHAQGEQDITFDAQEIGDWVTSLWASMH